MIIPDGDEIVGDTEDGATMAVAAWADMVLFFFQFTSSEDGRQLDTTEKSWNRACPTFGSSGPYLILSRPFAEILLGLRRER